MFTQINQWIIHLAEIISNKASSNLPDGVAIITSSITSGTFQAFT